MNATATIDSAHLEHTAEPRRSVERRGTDRPSDAQYMRALERANEVRIARAELKRRVAMGKVDAADVVMNPPWEAASMAVGDLLMSQRRWGQTRCRKLLAQIPMTERKAIGSMTDRQRTTLAALLSGSRRTTGESSEPPARPLVSL